MLKPGQDKDVPNKQKKWAVPGTAQGNAVFMPDKWELFFNFYIQMSALFSLHTW